MTRPAWMPTHKQALDAWRHVWPGEDTEEKIEGWDADPTGQLIIDTLMLLTARTIGEHLEAVIDNAPRGKRLAAVEHAIQELQEAKP